MSDKGLARFGIVVPRSSRVVALVACAAVVLLASGCRASVSVGAVVATDGSGQVVLEIEFDEDFVETAAEQGFGDSVAVLADAGAAEEAFGDAVAAGWQVEVPTTGHVVLRHEFHDGEEAQTLLADIAGAGVLFERFDLSTGGSLVRNGVDVDVVFTVPDDFHAQLLLGVLGGAAEGVPTVEELRDVVGLDLTSPPPVGLSLAFEGSVSEADSSPPPAETLSEDGHTVFVWEVPEGGAVSASVRSESWTWVVWALAATVLVVAAGAVALVALRRRT